MTSARIVLLSSPFALVGGVWLSWWTRFNFSVAVAVAVGFIALAGVAAETGVIMLTYLNQAVVERRHEVACVGCAVTPADLKAAMMAGLMPILWATGTGREVISRIAVPMIGGGVSSTILTLVLIPAVYAIVKY